MKFDADVSRRLLASYSTPDVVAQRATVRSLLAVGAGEQVLDIGSGPGLLAAELAAAGAVVTGVDPSPAMLAMGRDQAPGVAFTEASAFPLPFADASFDAITCTQVYEYVADMPAALAEAHRVLRPGGRLLVLDTDWDSIVWFSSDPERMRRVLTAWDAHLADPYLPRRLGPLLRGAGFAVTRVETVPLLNVGWDEQTYSAYLIAFISAFVGNSVDEWADELRALGADYFFSLNRYVFVAQRQ